ncbi:ribonuclease HI [Desmospora sp. 8437]|nr:ribonuclease HI [Desmospora sp. 8437]
MLVPEIRVPGVGAVLIHGDRRKEITGGSRQTTNNRMELTAALEALRNLKQPCRVKLHTDSAYLANCFKQKWYVNWERRGWVNSRNEPVENKDLWQELLREVRKHEVEFVKVKGHSDVELNNRCDELAREAIPKG